MKEGQSKLLFVYNADCGLGYQAFDFLHKIVSSVTNQCSLCALTYGNFQMKKAAFTFCLALRRCRL